MNEKKATELVPVSATRAELPPILVGRHAPAVEAQVRSFYGSVADIFERWVTRRTSKHTQRAYRQDVMDFVHFLGIRWPEDSARLFTVSVAKVQAFRDRTLAENKAPKPGGMSYVQAPVQRTRGRYTKAEFAQRSVMLVVVMVTPHAGVGVASRRAECRATALPRAVVVFARAASTSELYRRRTRNELI